MLVAVGIGVGLANRTQTHGLRAASERDAAGEFPSPTAASEPGVRYTCGKDLPVSVPVPDGYEGPHDGPSPQSPDAASLGQLVRHWTSETGSVEVRWPADGEGHFSASPQVPTAAGNAETMAAASTITSTAAGAVATTTVYLPAQPDTCSQLQIAIFVPTVVEADMLASQLLERLGDASTPLVAKRLSMDSAPPVGRCQSADGPPNVGGPVTNFGSYPTAAEALRSFVETQGDAGNPVTGAVLARRGYTEITLSDGSIAYAYEPEPGFWATIIRVARQGANWTVANWQASGC